MGASGAIGRAAIFGAVALGSLGAMPPRPTPAQLAMAETREYTVTPAAFRAAALKALGASHAGAYRITEADGEIIATYEWRRFVGIGVATTTDTWDIRYQSKGSGTSASIHEAYRSGGLVTLPAPVFTEIASYNLFWARLDYVLGRRADWTTCPDWRATMLPPRTPRFDIRNICGVGDPDTGGPPPRI